MRDSRVFFGWWVVVGVFVGMTTSSGLGFYNIAVVLEALTEERGFSVSEVSATVAFFFVVSGLTGLGVARLIERYDPRWTIVSGAVLGAIGLVLLGRVAQLWQLYAAYAVFGVGFAATSLVPGTTLVTRWFVRRRSVALSIATTGLSLGGIVLTPLSARLIDSQGLSSATPWLGAMYIVGIVPISLLLIRPHPESLGLLPDGEEVSGPADVAPSRLAAEQGVEFSVAVRSRFFRSVTGCYIFAMLAQVGVIAHQFKFVSDGSSSAAAAMAVSLLAAASIVGRLAGGWIVTVVRLRSFVLAILLLQILALVGFSTARSEVAFLLASVCFGLTVGNLLMLQPLLLADAFGTRDYPRIYSFCMLFTTIGVAGGPALLGFLHDSAGGYRPGFLTAAAVSAIALVWFWATGRAKSRPAAAPAA